MTEEKKTISFVSLFEYNNWKKDNPCVLHEIQFYASDKRYSFYDEHITDCFGDHIHGRYGDICIEIMNFIHNLTLVLEAIERAMLLKVIHYRQLSYVDQTTIVNVDQSNLIDEPTDDAEVIESDNTFVQYMRNAKGKINTLRITLPEDKCQSVINVLRSIDCVLRYRCVFREPNATNYIQIRLM